MINSFFIECSQPTSSVADLVAMRFQLQAAQHVGDLAAEFARVQRVAPDLGQRIGERLALVAVQHRGHFGLAARHQHDEARLFGQREMDGVIGGGVAGVQGGDHVDRSGRLDEVVESATDRFRKDMPPKPRRAASSSDLRTSSSRGSMPMRGAPWALKNRS
jgi:hypothetical protein